jgi:4-amino-4-deoxy-L-arabinose transferase-like glycosyltransferase
VRERDTRAVWAIAAAAALGRALLTAGLELYADEAYYWLWSRRPAFGYFDHPPMVAWLISISTALVPGEIGVRVLFVACGGLAVVFAALAAREASDDRRAPIYAALLAAAAPLLSLTGALALPDAPVEAAYCAATWLIARARGRGWLIAGAAVGLALLSKYTAALLAPALVLLVLWDRDLREELATPWPWAGAAVAIAVFLPCLLWDASHGFVSIGFQLHHGFRRRPSLETFLEFVGGQIVGPGPVVAVLALVLPFASRQAAERRLAAISVLPVLVTAWSALRGPVEANWTALALPGLCAAAAVVLCRLPAGRALVVASVALGLALQLGFAIEARSPHLVAPDSPAVERFHGWREFAARAKEAAGRACAGIGNPPGCDENDPFVFPENYQYASELAYYAGWRRIGPAQNRPTQLDVWDERPPEGSGFLQVGHAGSDRGRIALGEGRGETLSFEVRLGDVKLRDGTVTPFSRFLGLQPRLPWGAQYLR